MKNRYGYRFRNMKRTIKAFKADTPEIWESRHYFFSIDLDDNGWPVQVDKPNWQINVEAAIDIARILLTSLICDWFGHDLEEYAADPENGRSEMVCHRCGQHWTTSFC